MKVGRFGRVWLRRIAHLQLDARLANDPGSFLRLARVRLVPIGHRGLEASLRVDGNRLDVILRPRSSDSTVMTETFLGRYHLPPIPLGAVGTILDLGANIGLTMAHFAILCPEARVVGVELDRENVELARRNVARWGERCRVLEGAIWIHDKPLRYRVAQGAECGAALAPEGSLEAHGMTIDTVLREVGWDAVDYVKMDIEGSERAVLRENVGWASRVRTIKVETHDGYDREQCAADLERLGFAASPDPRHPSAVSGVRRM